MKPVRTRASSHFIDDAHAVLTKHGVRATRTRELVLEVFGTAKKALSPRAVREAALAILKDKPKGSASSAAEGPRPKKTEATPRKKKLTEIDTVTVYRCIELLQELKLIHEVRRGEFMACHHLSCGEGAHIIIHCPDSGMHREVALPKKLVQKIAEYLLDAEGFTIDEHSFSVDGTCSSCAPKSKGRPRTPTTTARALRHAVRLKVS